MDQPETHEPGAVWNILRSRYVVNDRWLRLRADDCRNAEGHDIAPFYVLEYPPWVSILALTPDHQAVLIRQYRHGIRRIILEFPGGAQDDADGSALAAAQRELREETGYVADDWREIGTLGACPNNHTNTLHTFLAFGARYATPPQREVSEHIEVTRLPLDELVERAFEGELAHPHHVSCLFFALRALGKA